MQSVLNEENIQKEAIKLAKLEVNSKVNYGKPTINLKNENGDIEISLSQRKDIAKNKSKKKEKPKSEKDALVFHLNDPIRLMNPQNVKETLWFFITFSSNVIRDKFLFSKKNFSKEVNKKELEVA